MSFNPHQTPVCVDVKIVPDADPNDDGRWITLTVNAWHVTKPNWAYLTSVAPKGTHVVAIRNVR